MWNLKCDTNELIYKTETDSQTQITVMWLPRGMAVGGGMDWEFGISRCKLLYREWINKVLLCNTGNYIQYPVINHNGKEYEKNVYTCITESLLYSRNQHNVVNQLYFNKINFKKDIGFVWSVPIHLFFTNSWVTESSYLVMIIFFNLYFTADQMYCSMFVFF